MASDLARFASSWDFFSRLLTVCCNGWNFYIDLFLLFLGANTATKSYYEQKPHIRIFSRFWAKNFHLTEQWLENMNVVLYINSFIENWVNFTGRAAKIFALSYCWIAERRLPDSKSAFTPSFTTACLIRSVSGTTNRVAELYKSCVRNFVQCLLTKQVLKSAWCC